MNKRNKKQKTSNKQYRSFLKIFNKLYFEVLIVFRFYWIQIAFRNKYIPCPYLAKFIFWDFKIFIPLNEFYFIIKYLFNNNKIVFDMSNESMDDKPNKLYLWGCSLKNWLENEVVCFTFNNFRKDMKILLSIQNEFQGWLTRRWINL